MVLNRASSDVEEWVQKVVGLVGCCSSGTHVRMPVGWQERRGGKRYRRAGHGAAVCQTWMAAAWANMGGIRAWGKQAVGHG